MTRARLPTPAETSRTIPRSDSFVVDARACEGDTETENISVRMIKREDIRRYSRRLISSRELFFENSIPENYADILYARVTRNKLNRDEAVRISAEVNRFEKCV